MAQTFDDDFTVPAAPVRPRRRGLGWPALALLVLLAFLGGMVGIGWAARHWDGVARMVAPAAPVAAPRIVRVPQPVAVPTPAAAGLADQVAAIDHKLDDVDARARAAVGNADRAEGLLVAFAARRAVDRGVDLGYIEGLIREHFAATEPQAVATIISGARRPVTLAGLKTGLDAARATLTSGSAGPSSNWGSFRQELSSLMVLRRSGAESTAPVDRLARAGTVLDSGQVDAALAEVSRMPGRAGAASWIADARRYLALRSALDRLETAALTAPPPDPLPPGTPRS